MICSHWEITGADHVMSGSWSQKIRISCSYLLTCRDHEHKKQEKTWRKNDPKSLASFINVITSNFYNSYSRSSASKNVKEKIHDEDNDKLPSICLSWRCDTRWEFAPEHIKHLQAVISHWSVVFSVTTKADSLLFCSATSKLHWTSLCFHSGGHQNFVCDNTGDEPRVDAATPDKSLLLSTSAPEGSSFTWEHLFSATTKAYYLLFGSAITKLHLTWLCFHSRGRQTVLCNNSGDEPRVDDQISGGRHRICVFPTTTKNLVFYIYQKLIQQALLTIQLEIYCTMNATSGFYGQQKRKILMLQEIWSLISKFICDCASCTLKEETRTTFIHDLGPFIYVAIFLSYIMGLAMSLFSARWGVFHRCNRGIVVVFRTSLHGDVFTFFLDLEKGIIKGDCFYRFLISWSGERWLAKREMVAWWWSLFSFASSRCAKPKKNTFRWQALEFTEIS